MSLSNQWTRRAGPVAAVAVVGALAVALTGCQNGSSPTGGGAGRVAAVVKGLDNPFFQTMQSGIESQASAGGSRRPCRPPTRSPTPPGRPTS